MDFAVVVSPNPGGLSDPALWTAVGVVITALAGLLGALGTVIIMVKRELGTVHRLVNSYASDQAREIGSVTRALASAGVVIPDQVVRLDDLLTGGAAVAARGRVPGPAGGPVDDGAARVSIGTGPAKVSVPGGRRADDVRSREAAVASREAAADAAEAAPVEVIVVNAEDVPVPVAPVKGKVDDGAT